MILDLFRSKDNKKAAEAAERIKEVRLLIGLTQSDFADKIKITQSNLARIETNTMVPRKNILNAICIVFNVRMEWLTNGEEPIFANGRNVYKQSIPTLSLIIAEVKRLLPDVEEELSVGIIRLKINTTKL